LSINIIKLTQEASVMFFISYAKFAFYHFQYPKKEEQEKVGLGWVGS